MAAGDEQSPQQGEAQAAPKDDTAGRPPADAPPLDEKAQRRAEVASFLGPDVRTPVGIPDGYAPNDRSIHPLFHVELGELDYAGPLDLLLYLIRRHDLDVLDTPIAFVTEKYLEMLQVLEALEVDIAAEFLVLAAELTHIKSKMLLPSDKGIAVEDPPEEVEQGDPRAELVRRLLEYQKYRDAAAQLLGREQLGRDVFPRTPPVMEKAEDLDPGLKQVSVFRLVELMARLLREAPVHHEISYESFSIGERIQFVRGFGEASEGRFTLLNLMRQIGSRTELVVTFIAVLEMAKMGLVRIYVEAFSLEDRELEAPPPTSPELDEGARVEEMDEAPERRLEDPDAVHREAEALEALAAEVEGESGFEPASVELSAKEARPAEALEPLPDVWIELTEKNLEVPVVDDYGGGQPPSEE